MGVHQQTKKAYTLSESSDVIELEVELESLHLNCAKDFYNDIVGVMDKYEVTKTNHDFAQNWLI